MTRTTAAPERRLLHVLYAPGLGGCESLALELVRHLDPDRVASEVAFLSEAGGPLLEALEELRVPVHVVPYGRGRRIAFVREIARLCRSRRIEAVISYVFGLHPLIAMGARLGGAGQVLACVGNPPPLDPRARRRSFLAAQLGRPFVRGEIACSHYVAGRIARAYRLPARRITVVHNWCDVDGVARRAAEARAERPSPDPVIGVVARLDPIKDHETVVRAFAIVLERFPESRLRIVGDGPRRGDLEALASSLGLGDRAVFLGTRRDVAEQLGQMDVFTYATTEEEGFGIVLAEAMAAGVPVVATDVGPCREVLDGAGLLVPGRDPAAMAAAVVTLWEDEDLRRDLVQRGFALASARYAAPVAARRIERILEDDR